MAKLLLTTVVLVALVAVAKSEGPLDQLRQATGNYGQDYAQNLPTQMPGQLGQGMNAIQGQFRQGMNSLQGQGQQQGGLLSGLFGGNGGSNSGPFETIRQLPARGLQMLNNVLGGVRNMLPLGLGRNSNEQNQNNSMGQLNPSELLQNLPKNPITDMLNRNGNGQNNGYGQTNGYGQGGLNGLRLPNLNQITGPIMEPLQQGRLPDLNEVTNGAMNTVRDLTGGLTDQLQGGNQGARRGLGNMLFSNTQQQYPTAAPEYYPTPAVATPQPTMIPS